MKETKFIEQNKEKWSKLEDLLRRKEKDPDELSKLFVQVTDDLSYCRTHYPNRSVRVYLNNITQRIYETVYRGRKERFWQNFLRFWSDELPRLMYSSRWDLALSFSIFLLALLIGLFSSRMDPSFPTTMLGESYIEMTKENISEGNPMGVYEDSGPLEMFLLICANNLRVAFLTFVLGVFWALGTIIVLINNGIMVGAFQYFFVEQGLLRESFLSIWMHGSIEIPSIIIAGCAGIVMGKGWLFPGTYSRLQSFQVAAIKGIKIMLGVVPAIVVAAIVESVITRYDEVHDLVQAVFIATGFGAMAWYYVLFPLRKARSGFKTAPHEKVLIKDDREHIDLGSIKNPGQIFIDTFFVYKKLFPAYFRWAFFLTILYVTLMLTFIPEMELQYRSGSSFVEPFYYLIDSLINFFRYDKRPALFLINFLLAPFLLLLINRFCIALFTGEREDNLHWKDLLKTLKKNGLSYFILILIWNVPLFLGNFIGFLITALITPMVMLILYHTSLKQEYFSGEIGAVGALIQQGLGRILGLYALLLLLSTLIMVIINSPVLYFYYEFINANLSLGPEWRTFVLETLFTFTTALAFTLVLPLVVIGFNIQYYSLAEIKYAAHLRDRVKKFQHRYGA